MAITQTEINYIAEKSLVIVNLNVDDFLKRIKESAEKWKKELSK